MKQWPCGRLGELTNVLSGFAFDSEGFSDSGDMPLVRIRDVTPGESSTFYRGTFDARYIVGNGDILIGMDGEFNRARWRGGRALLNQRVSKITPSCPDLDGGYLFHFLPSALKAIEQVTPFVTVKHLSVKQIRDISIPLPPMPQQRRIATILDKADALRAKRRAALAKLDTLTQSIFLDMFGDPATNPKRWPVGRLADLLAIPLRNGLSPSHAGTVSARVLTLSAITGNEFDADAWKTSTFQSMPPPEQSVREDDFLICRGNGNVGLVGKAFFPTRRMPDVTFPDTMIAARVLPERVDRAFLQHVWNSTAVRRQIESVARTTNGTYKVNQTMLEEIGFVLPPETLQRDFACCAAAIASLNATHRSALTKLDALFSSLQHRAFRGEL